MSKLPVGRDDAGKSVLGEPIDFTATSEEWNEYRLADGAVLRLKCVVTAVLKTDKTDPLGIPVYVVRSQNVLDVRPPTAQNTGDA